MGCSKLWLTNIFYYGVFDEFIPLASSLAVVSNWTKELDTCYDVRHVHQQIIGQLQPTYLKK